MKHREHQRESGTGAQTDCERENARAGSALNAKEYLMQYRESMERTAEIEQHLAELKAEAIRLKDHEGQSVKLDDATAKYVDACEEMSAELMRLHDLREEIRRMIEAVPDTKLRSLLRWRYISGYTWEQVAVQMHYTYRRAIQLHGAALQDISRILARNSRTSAV